MSSSPTSSSSASAASNKITGTHHPVVAVVNPYKRKKKGDTAETATPPATTKRRERQEQEENNAAVASATPMAPEQSPRKKSPRMALTEVSSNTPQEGQHPPKHDAPATMTKTDDCEYGDGGIDWDVIDFAQMDQKCLDKTSNAVPGSDSDSNSNGDNVPRLQNLCPSTEAVAAPPPPSCEVPRQDLASSCASTVSSSSSSSLSSSSVPAQRQPSATTASNTPPPPPPAASSSAKVSRLPPLPDALAYHKKRVEPVEDAHRQELIRHANVSAPLKNGMTLFNHQKASVLRGLSMRRFILALDMGLGKTLVACVWAKAFRQVYHHEDKFRIYVVCPTTLKRDWCKTAREATGLSCEGEGVPEEDDDEEEEEEEKEENDDEDDGDNDDEEEDKEEEKSAVKTMTTTSEKGKDDHTGKDKTNKSKAKGKKRGRKKTDKKKKKKKKPRPPADMTLCTWQKIPTVPRSMYHYVVICDEAHYMQSMSSRRTQDALNLVLAKRCVGVLLLTGTPMKNGKPGNLFPLLKAVKHPFGDSQRTFETYFCNGHLRQVRGGVIWDASGSSNLEVLRAHISSHMLHITKEEASLGKTLPPKTRVCQTVPVSARSQVLHTSAMNELGKVLQSCSGRGKEKDDPQNSDALLSAFTKVRTIASLAKVDAVVSLADSILQDESSIVIFTNFVSVAQEVSRKLISKGWTGQVLTGEVPAKKRGEMVESFQEGLSAFFVATFGVGGIGLTLTAACTAILLDRPWTPGEALQAEDRVRRIGQTRPVRCIWMTAFDVDQQIDALIHEKEKTTQQVVTTRGEAASSSSSSGKGAPPPKISLVHLVKSITQKEKEEEEEKMVEKREGGEEKEEEGQGGGFLTDYRNGNNLG